MLDRLLAMLCLVLVAGCSTGAADKSIQFNSESKKALVVFGWEGLERFRGFTVGVSFRGADNAGMIDKRQFFVSNGNGWEAMAAVEYFVVEAEPGAYFAHSTLTHFGQGNNIAVHCKGTVGFEVNAGEVAYIGNIVAPQGVGAIRVTRRDFEAAKKKLAEYPGVTQSLIEVKMNNRAFPPAEICERAR